MLVSTTLIDAQYYVALHENGGVMPRWQDVPAAARIDHTNVWRIRHAWNDSYKTPTLVWTYCWYNKYHPDPIGEQLGRAVPVLKVMLKEVKKMGEHMTVGVLQDYASYPQYPRTEDQQARFDAGLKAELNRWYAHPYTPVLMVTNLASEHPLHTNRRPYDARGWTYVERRLSSMVKDSRCLWDLSKCTGREADWFDLADSMMAGRPPVTSPDRVERELREGVRSGALAFTASADLDLVVRIYRRGFLQALAELKSAYIGLQFLGWGDEAVPVLAEAIRYAAKHHKGDRVRFCLGYGNNFTWLGRQRLRYAAWGFRSRVGVDFTIL